MMAARYEYCAWYGLRVPVGTGRSAMVGV